MKKGDWITRTHVDGTGQEITIEAEVNWVIGDEAGIAYLSPEPWKGGMNVIDFVKGPDKWTVTHESAPSFQSSVAEMTEDELRESIDHLRETRKHIPVTKPRSQRVGKAKSSDPMAKALAGLSKKEQAELIKKLGL